MYFFSAYGLLSPPQEWSRTKPYNTDNIFSAYKDTRFFLV